MQPAPELPPELHPLIRQPAERRNVEYKRSMPWPDIRPSLVKAALGMSNLVDGGYIVLGVTEVAPGVLRADGMNSSHFDSYIPDDINDAIRIYAEPPFAVLVLRGRLDGNRYVVIRVPPFDEMPTICRRDGGPSSELREGAIYTRSIHKPETVEVRSQNEMRQVITRAIDIGMRRMQDRVDSWRVAIPTDEERFRQERGAFE